MPEYRVLTKSYIGDKLVDAGEVVGYEGEVGSNLELIEADADVPVDTARKGRKAAAPTDLA